MTPLTISKTSTNSTHNIVRVLAGADPKTGRVLDGRDSSSFGAHMRDLANGKWMQAWV